MSKRHTLNSIDLTSRTENTYETFLKLCRDYKIILASNPFPVPDSKTIYESITFYKRNRFSIGPYQTITVFEAANRIATDMVILSGIKEHLSKMAKDVSKVKITIHFGNEHVKEKGDFEINELQGEAFNVAPSFLNVKLDKTLKTSASRKIMFILYNGELEYDAACLTTIGNAKIKYPHIKFLPVMNWRTL